MKITFLGTGTSQGIPIIACNCKACLSENQHDKRLRSSIMIENAGLSIVIDSGPDFRQQMLREHVSTLEAIVFTHGHWDHIAGLDDIRSFNYLQKKSMDIYAEEGVFHSLEATFPYVFAEDKYPGVPSVSLHEIEGKPFSIGDLEFIPIRMYHAALPVFGFRINDFAYLVDANAISEEEKRKLKGVKYIVIGALRKEKHHSHFTLSEAIELFKESGAEKGYITHISHQMGMEKEYASLLPGGMTVAYDGLVLEV